MAKSAKKEPATESGDGSQVVGLNSDIIIQGVESRLETWKARGDEVALVAQKLIVTNDDEYAKAVDILSGIAGEKKKIEEARKSLGDPMRLLVEKINSMFKVVSTPFLTADTTIRRKADDYDRAKQEAIRRENERLQREAEERAKRDLARSVADGTPPPAAPSPATFSPEIPKTVVGAEGGAATRKTTWDFEIINQNEIPREYLMPNEKFIRAAIQAGKRDIPGVKIYERSGLAVRAR
jgi:hypothetical protein